MSFLVDSSVLLEQRVAPDERVEDWFAAVRSEDLYISAVTVGELRRSALLLVNDDPAGAAELDRWLRELLGEHASRVLPIDHVVADLWGRTPQDELVDERIALLIATAQVHHLTIVTRNAEPLRARGIACIDPAVHRPPKH